MDIFDKERKTLYTMGLIILGLIPIFILLFHFTPIRFGNVLLPCLFHYITGLYCPGCGGSRSVTALLTGHPIQSFIYHPIVLYGFALYLWFMVSNTIHLLSKGKYPVGMKYRRLYVWIGAAILALNFIIKNGLLLIWHCPLIN